MELVAVQGHRKEGSGKNYAKQVRRSGLVPANMYKSGGDCPLKFKGTDAVNFTPGTNSRKSMWIITM